jgi:hypothetical protein
MKKLLLILVLLVSVPVLATDWRETGITGGSGLLKQIYLNYDSFTPTSRGTYEAWSKFLYKLKDPKSLAERNYCVCKYEFDCDKLLVKTLRLTAFNQEGEHIISFDTPDYSFHEPVPDTVEEALVEYVCKLAKEAEGIK